MFESINLSEYAQTPVIDIKLKWNDTTNNRLIEDYLKQKQT